MRDGRVDISLGLQENLDDRNPVERLAFEMLDVVDRRDQHPLEIADHSRLHFVGRDAAVAPNHRDHGDFDLGKDIGRHPHDRHHAENGDQHRHHDKGIRPPKCETNDPHGGWRPDFPEPKARSAIIGAQGGSGNGAERPKPRERASHSQSRPTRSLPPHCSAALFRGPLPPSLFPSFSGSRSGRTAAPNSQRLDQVAHRAASAPRREPARKRQSGNAVARQDCGPARLSADPTPDPNRNPNPIPTPNLDRNPNRLSKAAPAKSPAKRDRAKAAVRQASGSLAVARSPRGAATIRSRARKNLASRSTTCSNRSLTGNGSRSERRLSGHFSVLCGVIPILQPSRRAALPASIERLSHALKILRVWGQSPQSVHCPPEEPTQDPEYPT